MSHRNHHPYRPPTCFDSGQQSGKTPDAETSLLLAMGLIMGVELVGVPLLLVITLFLEYEIAGDPFWFVFAVLTVASVLAACVFAKLLKLARPAERSVGEAENGDHEFWAAG